MSHGAAVIVSRFLTFGCETLKNIGSHEKIKLSDSIVNLYIKNSLLHFKVIIILSQHLHEPKQNIDHFLTWMVDNIILQVALLTLTFRYFTIFDAFGLRYLVSI